MQFCAYPAWSVKCVPDSPPRTSGAGSIDGDIGARRLFGCHALLWIIFVNPGSVGEVVVRELGDLHMARITR